MTSSNRSSDARSRRWYRDLASAVHRKYIRADIRAGDRFFEPGIPATPPSKPGDFLRAGKTGRFFEILWRGGLFLVSAAVFLFFTAILLYYIVDHERLVPWLFLAIFTVMTFLSGWLALSSQAYLRWMIRNRSLPSHRGSKGN